LSQSRTNARPVRAIDTLRDDALDAQLCAHVEELPRLRVE
jgi:hypothetical protein